VIDRGEPVSGSADIATTGAAAAPQASPGSGSATPGDGLWKAAGSQLSEANQVALSPGKSVYGEGVGMLRHSQTAQRVPTDSSSAPDEPPRGAPDHSKQVILEWTRQ
jgi:hypothetical protein